MSKTDGPITLFFEDFTRIAGETIQGRVVLDVASAQEDNLELLRIKFRGTIRTQIMTSNGNTTVTHTQTILLIHEDLLLWDQGTVPPEPASESHIMSYPFHFTLPETLPPSFHCLGYHKNGTIGYSLEVVGERSRFFRFNRRIRRPISVVPAATQAQLLIRESLRQGWTTHRSGCPPRGQRAIRGAAPGGAACGSRPRWRYRTHQRAVPRPWTGSTNCTSSCRSPAWATTSRSLSRSTSIPARRAPRPRPASPGHRA
ncbi:hypothetical protein B0H15DRAFT_547612 [Mycena belliarum]|uniref:Arrestin-like N-terminal domain-containing protein n=1 Tax=Mycena belliarum TaxID=1033014 RepID=A0AAD6UK42_9AGAR|nr:hypothetical protein B0H15DRAFT_547612 [Mycena belliae]